jgi:hypothetical protein
MRQCTDQVEPVRSVRSRAVKGRVRSRRRARLRLGSGPHLLPSGPRRGRRLREAIRDSESYHWATRLTGPLQVSTPRLPEASGCPVPRRLGPQTVTGLLALFAPPARLAPTVTTDSVLGPAARACPRPSETSRPSDRAHGARLVATGRSGMASHGQPANGRTPGDQAHGARPRATSKSSVAGHGWFCILYIFCI